MNIKIPETFPVRPLKAEDTATDRVTCGACGLSWDDAIATAYTPADAARCPFEAFHLYEEEKKAKRHARSGISVDRAYRIQKLLAERVRDIFSSARLTHPTSEHISSQIRSDVLNAPEYDRAPGHVRAYIQGVLDTLWHNMHHYHLVWVHSLDGMLMVRDEVALSTDKEMATEYAAYVKRCGKPEDGSYRDPPTFSEFSRNWSKFLPSDYKSPWMRVDTDKSRFVWKDGNGKPLLNRPYDKKFL